ncbi:MAG: zinc ribbon domain-containing protein [Eubacteriales bacterium]|nr:zinc ribbon domain-containing protein [Eubacteriales bacterium]
MRHCPKCGAETDGKFCGKCGQNLQEVIENTEYRAAEPENSRASEVQEAGEELTDEETEAGYGIGKIFIRSFAVILAAAILCIAAVVGYRFYQEKTRVEEFDPFENLTITFAGVGPDGTAKAEVVTTNPAVKAMTFTMDRNYGLSNGDEVVVTVTMKDGSDPEKSCKDTYRQMPTRLKATYTVEGLEHYPASASEIAKDSIQEMRAMLKASLQRDITNWNKALIDQTEYLGCYYLVAKDEKNDPRNELFIVERIDVLTNGGDTFSFYYYIAYTNVIVDEDGKVVNELKDYQPPMDINEMSETETHVSYFGFPTLDEMENRIFVVDTFEMVDKVTDKPKEPNIITGTKDSASKK